jgi:hypothetical protein
MNYFKIADTDLNISFTDLENLGLGFLVKEEAKNINLKFYLMNYEVRLQLCINNEIEFECYISAIEHCINEKELKKIVKELVK